MAKPPRQKIKRRPKHITAHSITLLDAKGKPRIYLDAGDGSGFATISLFGEGGRSIQISTAPDGGVHISLKGERSTAAATLGMGADERAALSIVDEQGRLGTMLGSSFAPGEHKLVLFREGQPYWSTPASSSPKQRRRKK